MNKGGETLWMLVLNFREFKVVRHFGFWGARLNGGGLADFEDKEQINDMSSCKIMGLCI